MKSVKREVFDSFSSITDHSSIWQSANNPVWDTVSSLFLEADQSPSCYSIRASIYGDINE